ncbi:PAS domain-containing sensor histidine kinase [Coraliomargarita sp. SDUM461003]|uniref:histidine kinase n=1 Tax=Thalassobacterium maritimum TaxID=3041265 RepID=A0ABU1ASK3_9BACT|nr:PAS domain-containing sensor histidine kinase [Coraliomargarita sp. SDUM461003]MDQ8205957.1 PAS domain-containing sensor histidine kinase [Coraliomargarita sp. SDUM461003]
MNYQHPTKETEALRKDLQQLQRAHSALKDSFNESVQRCEQLEVAYNQSQQKYQLLATNSLEVIWTLDLEHQFTYISPSIYKLRGLSPEEAMAETLEATVTAESYQLLRSTLLQCQQETGPLRIEVEQYHKNGQLIWVELYLKTLQNKRGELIGFVGNSRNITRRKQSQQATQQLAERFESLVAKAPIGIYVLGLNASQEIEFKYVSDRWCEIHQITREEVMSDISCINKRINQDDQESFISMNKEAIRHKKRFVWEGRMRSGDEERWFRIESVPIALENGEYQWYGAAKDITPRKQSENALRENEVRLRELNAQKDKFFSIIAHDLMGPFNGILGFSELLVAKINENDYEGIDEYAAMIEQSSKQSVELLRNLLEWSRAQTGRLEFKPVPLDLNNLITENTRLFDVIAAQKSITIVQDLPAPLQAFADPQMIRTVLRNLVSNAIKFSHPRGQITVNAHQDAAEIVISVRDNGVGISSNRLQKLFRIDENDSTLGTKQETGTGLGLILCKEFIEQHQGRIWIESQKGSGSTFYFSLPIKHPASTQGDSTR